MELVDVQYHKLNKWLLRVFIDKEGGVDLSDCEKVSKELKELLGEIDFTPSDYFLEVSSPGLDRVLKKEKDFKRFLGHRIKITTYKPMNNQRHFTVKLIGCEEGIIKIENEQGECLTIPLEEIAKARLFLEI
ncbi:ribosome maturation factor RimP [bacterium]|nr:ribosome maturation factor RimP [bacterium]